MFASPEEPTQEEGKKKSDLESSSPYDRFVMRLGARWTKLLLFESCFFGGNMCRSLKTGFHLSFEKKSI